MRRHSALLCAFLLFLSGSTAFADLAAIHQSALPQETAVLAALDDAQQLEPYSSSWYPKWPFSISQEEVARRLDKDFSFLSAALKNHPENLELQLLTGLVAHYAYNVDVPDSHDKAAHAFEQALSLAPGDMRARWFQASLMCQTDETLPGANEFLAIESSRPSDQLPAAFWNDYLECATVTNMPAHALQATTHLKKLQTHASKRREQLEQIAQNRFIPFDPAAKLEPKDVWYGSSSDADPKFTSTLCGVRVTAHGTWEINQIGWSNGSCVVYFSTGPYKATKRDLRPSILLLVQQPKEHETLNDYLQKFMKKGTFEPFTPAVCPATGCLAMKGVQPGMYGADGDGHGRIVAFERDQPEFPGLLFEAPQGPPKSGGAQGTSYYRPSQTRQRIPGKLYYLVVLDTAASIEELAGKDLDFFLQNLTVE